MRASAVVLYAHHVGTLSGGLGSLGSTIAHAAIWSVVSRLLWHAPVAVFVLAALGAAAFIVVHQRRRR